MRFDKGKISVLYLERSNCMHQFRLEADLKRKGKELCRKGTGCAGE